MQDIASSGTGGEAGSRAGKWAVAVLVLGAGLQLWLWSRPVWVYRDQVELYTLGEALARSGELRPGGKLMSGDLPVPGVLLQLLIGLPLAAWSDLRAPTLLLLLSHLAAAIVLTRVTARRFGWRAAAVYLAVLWLSPWRLYHSAFLWEANYLLLPAVVHLWASDRLRDCAAPGASAALAATVLLTFQIHASALILVLATVWLLRRRRIRLHRAGALAGAALGAATLAPGAFALMAGAAGWPWPNLLERANSVEKTILYWFRFGSLDVGRRFREIVFCTGAGGTSRDALGCALTRVTEVLALASVVLALAAGVWLWRQRGGGGDPAAGEREWARTYCLTLLGAALVSAALSPVLIQGWHVLLLLPAACLPVALWIEAGWSSWGRGLRWAAALFLVWRLPAALLLGLGHPMYAEPPSPSVLEHLAPAELRHLF